MRKVQAFLEKENDRLLQEKKEQESIASNEAIQKQKYLSLFNTVLNESIKPAFMEAETDFKKLGISARIIEAQKEIEIIAHKYHSHIPIIFALFFKSNKVLYVYPSSQDQNHILIFRSRFNIRGGGVSFYTLNLNTVSKNEIIDLIIDIYKAKIIGL